MSIKDAPGNVSWQNVNDWVADFQRGTDFNPVDKDEYVNIATGFDATGNINRILGYQNTKVLWAYNGYCKTNGKTDALVNPAEVLKTFIANNPAPANSTGWFLPSVKELHMLCYKDVDNIAYTRDNTETRDIVEVSISAVGGDALSPRNNHKRFWSSSRAPVIRMALLACISTMPSHSSAKRTAHSMCVPCALSNHIKQRKITM